MARILFDTNLTTCITVMLGSWAALKLVATVLIYREFKLQTDGHIAEHDDDYRQADSEVANAGQQERLNNYAEMERRLVERDRELQQDESRIVD